MTQLAAIRTPLVPPQLRDAIGRAWPDAPTNAIAVLMAQIGLETGWKSCVCWNLGNVKASPDASATWCTFSTWEMVGGKRVEFPAGSPGAAFRAFATLDEGVTFYLDILRHRFVHAWPAVLSGNPREFARLLREQGYYTAPFEDYATGLERIFEDWATPLLRTQWQIDEAVTALGFASVRAFQCAKGLVADGIAGPMTKRAIRADMVPRET